MSTTSRVSLIVVLVAAALLAQSAVQLIPIWSGNRYVFARLGPGLTLNNGVLDVAKVTTPVRQWNRLLSWDVTAQAYRMPAGARNVVLRINGLTQGDSAYALDADASLLIPVGVWPAPQEAEVRIDYDL